MPRWSSTRTVIHRSPEDRSNQFQGRLLKVTLWLLVVLWSGGILAFIVLHILQAMISQHVTLPDLSPIVLLPPVIGLFFNLGYLGTTSLVREIRLVVFGRSVVGEPVRGTTRSKYYGDGEFKPSFRSLD
jgi:hypothetical protein